MNRSLKIIIFLFFVFSSFSCLETAPKFKEIARLNMGRSEGRIIVYLYTRVAAPQDINFTIDKIELEKKDGNWANVLERPVTVKAHDIAKNQIQLSESFLKEGYYSHLRMRVSNATIRRDKERYSLALPQPMGEVHIKVAVKIISGDCIAIFFRWDPDQSVEKNYMFRPSLKFENQKVSPQPLHLYVTNSGSDYVSVIDRFENRVVKVIGVEEKPRGLLLSKEQERLYVLNTLSNTISIIDTLKDNILGRIQLLSGMDPMEMAMVPYIDKINHGKLYITNYVSNDVTVIDTFVKSRITNIRVGNGPMGVTADPVRQEVYVANSQSNSISIINSLNDTVKATISVDTKPVDVVLVNGSLYVLNAGSNRITVIDPSSRKIIRSISAGTNPRKGIYFERYRRVYLTNFISGQVSFLIPSSSAITRSIKVGRQPIGLAMDEDRNRLYTVNYGSDTVTVVNPVSEQIESNISVGKNPYGIASITLK